MAYYVRLLSPSKITVPLGELRAALTEAGLAAKLEVEEGTPARWRQVLLSQKDDELVLIERNAVGARDGLAKEELAEFIADLDGEQPERNARWLAGYLPTVQTTYAFQILADEGWQEALTPVKTRLWNRLGGIFQADYEGFSNEEGYGILWQFSDRARGPWWMGLLDEEGRWVHFQIELSNRAHRAAFLAGQVPPGVTTAASAPPAEPLPRATAGE